MKKAESVNQFDLQYHPLSLFKDSPTNFSSYDYTLKVHKGKASNEKLSPSDDIDIGPNTLLAEGKAKKPVMMICITMYNEPFSQLLESLAGVFRAYYELVDIDEGYKDRVQV